jgi:hypothetical protein
MGETQPFSNASLEVKQSALSRVKQALEDDYGGLLGTLLPNQNFKF